MKKMDEMERSIQLHAEEWGYKGGPAVPERVGALQLLAGAHVRSEYSPLPALILCLAVCVQGFSQMAMRRRMVAGDEEYRSPNKLLRAAVAAIVVIALALSVGAYLLARA